MMMIIELNNNIEGEDGNSKKYLKQRNVAPTKEVILKSKYIKAR
jgi:hypothetical protein